MARAFLGEWGAGSIEKCEKRFKRENGPFASAENVSAGENIHSCGQTILLIFL
jgi:hypothetical protein